MTEMGKVFPPVPVMPALMGFVAVFICSRDVHRSMPFLVVAWRKYGLDTWRPIQVKLRRSGSIPRTTWLTAWPGRLMAAMV